MNDDIGISKTGMSLAIALGAMAPIVINRSLELAGTANDVPFLAVSGLVFGVVGVLSAYLIRAPVWVVAILVYGGIAIGILIDSIIDQFAFSKDRNLFPLEIVAMWTIALVPVAAGLLFGKRMRRNVAV
jgi:cytosine/uracil/thiamine/allantoin permease